MCGKFERLNVYFRERLYVYFCVLVSYSIDDLVRSWVMQPMVLNYEKRIQLKPIATKNRVVLYT